MISLEQGRNGKEFNCRGTNGEPRMPCKDADLSNPQVSKWLGGEGWAFVIGSAWEDIFKASGEDTGRLTLPPSFLA